MKATVRHTWVALLVFLLLSPLAALPALAVADDSSEGRIRQNSRCKVWDNDDLEALLAHSQVPSLSTRTLGSLPCNSAQSSSPTPIAVARARNDEVPAVVNPPEEPALSPGEEPAPSPAEESALNPAENSVREPDFEYSAASMAPVPSDADGDDAFRVKPYEEPPPEIRPVRTRWRTVSVEGHPELTYHLWDPYGQNLLKGDFPVAGNLFLELSALNTMVYKSRRNLDFSAVFPDLIGAGSLRYVSHNSFYAENLIFGGELRLNDDTFMPSSFRLRINGAADFKHNINALQSGSDGNAHLFDAFVDVRVADLGHENFDLVFLRAGFQGFRSDFHGLVLNDVGLGGRLFGEAKKNRLRYDFAYFKLFNKNPVSGFTDFRRPSRHQVAVARLTVEDFLAPGWNSEWTFHYNRDHRKLAGFSETADLDTFYFGAVFNGRLGRWIFNPAIYGVAGHAERLEGIQLVRHSVAGWMGLLDLQYPLDYWRFRFGYLYASGDSDPSDRHDNGFDAISDGIGLFGGPLSYWVGENVKFGPGDLLRANSLFPSLRGVNDSANHINPGLQVLNGGVDVVLSPRWQLLTNLNYLRFAETGSYNNRVVIGNRNAGLEFNVFIRWRPLLKQLNENFVIDNGFSLLHPLDGLEGAFQSGRTVYSTFTSLRFIF